LLWRGDASAISDSAGSRKHRPAPNTRGPDLAIDAAFVAKPIDIAGLPEHFVELGFVCFGDLGTDFSDRSIIWGGVAFPGNRLANGPHERVRQFESRRLSNVKAVDKPVSYKVKIAGDGRA